MSKKLVLKSKSPELPVESIDIMLIIIGIAVIGFVIYGASKNGKIIEASHRFGKQPEQPSNTNNETGKHDQ